MTQTNELSRPEGQLSPESSGVAHGSDSPARGAWIPPALLRSALVPVLVAIMVMAVVAVTLIASGRSEPAFVVSELADGRLHFIVARSFDDPKSLQDALKERGMEVEVARVVAHPRLVGILELVPLADSQGIVGQMDGIELARGEFWVDLTRFKGKAELVVYAEATNSSEQWQQSPSVFHPDEPLGGLPCATGGPLDSATLEHEAQHVGIRELKWMVQTRVSEEGFDAVEQETRPDGEVDNAFLYGPGRLRVIVRPAPLVERLGHLPAPSMSLNADPTEEPPCTAELAGRWLAHEAKSTDRLLSDATR